MWQLSQMDNETNSYVIPLSDSWCVLMSSREIHQIYHVPFLCWPQFQRWEEQNQGRYYSTVLRVRSKVPASGAQNIQDIAWFLHLSF